ncbi:MAG TPA: GDP-L-fucose synthase family protein [Candidatus Avalokitesvara rifleensis]|uniref:GDP-L-fucose synthase family protein n=1 Tax=Candidatus Avalokitesvara rifleensis TaxID=3367620 RepID=UPI0027131BD8|nr:GDP-L-fucose synthase [Candidatus Brocadiales bacterium]
MEKGAKIFVAGHQGMIGAALVRRLREDGHTNLLLRTSSELNLLDQKAVSYFFSAHKPEYVFLATGKVGGILANSTYPAEFIYINLQIQNNVIHCAFESGVKKLLFLGSPCMYPKFCQQPMKEEYLLTGPIEPTNEPYAIAKIAGVKMCQSYNRQYGTNFMPVIPADVYGTNDDFSDGGHVVPSLIRKFHGAMTNGSNSITLWGTGKPRREFLYADDLSEALIFLMHVYDGSEVINVGTGYDTSVAELARSIKKMVGFDGKIIYDKTKPDGMPRRLLDVSRITSLGWKPKTGLVEGLELTYAWYKQCKMSNKDS